MARFPKYQRSDQTARTVLTMTGYGIDQEQIGTLLELDPKTLRKNYRRELDTGAIEANARVVESLYRNATKNENVAAQIWWTKTRMGWKDTSRIENTGADGNPLAIDFRWADAPAPPPEPTIEGRAEPGEPDLVEWEAPKLAND